MTSYYREFRHCPHCDYEFSYMGTASYNSFGARRYTDGCVEGAMYDMGSAIVACPCCNRYLWVQEARPSATREYDHHPRERFYEADEWSIEHQIPVGLDASGLYGDQFAEALNSKLYSCPEQEKYLRVMMWWSFNNGHRKAEMEGCIELPQEQRDNLSALRTLLVHENVDERIMAAELMRELGNFDACIAVCDSIIDDFTPKKTADIEGVPKRGAESRLLHTVKQIQSLAEQRYNRVSVVH